MGLYGDIEKNLATDRTLPKISDPPPTNVANVADPKRGSSETPVKSGENSGFRGSKNCNIPATFATSGSPEGPKRGDKCPKTHEKHQMLQSLCEEGGFGPAKRIMAKKADSIIRQILENLHDKMPFDIIDWILDRADRPWAAIMAAEEPPANAIGDLEEILRESERMM